MAGVTYRVVTMCELLAMSMRSPARVSVSLASLTARSDVPGRARDGWGFAAYQGRDVALFREPRPAAQSAIARLLLAEGPVTPLALAHLRHATRGEVTLANTQPFVREMHGAAHVFAHNGDLPGIARSTSRTSPRGEPCCMPIGTTDSEIAFCELLQRLAVEPAPATDHREGIARRLEIVAAFAADLRRLGPANFIFADGRVLYAHAHRRMQAPGTAPAPPGLHLLRQRCGAGMAAVATPDLCIEAAAQQVAVVASVPLSDGPWQALDEGEVLAIADGDVVGRVRPRAS